MKIGTFDLGMKRTGFCAGKAGEVPSRSGSWSPRPNNQTHTPKDGFASLGRGIQRLIEVEHPDVIAVERELNPMLNAEEDEEGNLVIKKGQKKTNKWTIATRYEMLGGLLTIASMWNIPVIFYSRQEVLKKFTGEGSYPAIRIGKRLVETGSMHGKRAVVAQCRRLGYIRPGEPDDHDRGDAIAVWYVCSVLHARLVPVDWNFFHKGKLPPPHKPLQLTQQ